MLAGYHLPFGKHDLASIDQSLRHTRLLPLPDQIVVRRRLLWEFAGARGRRRGVGIVIRSTLDVVGLLAAAPLTLARLAAEVAPRPAETSAPEQPLGTGDNPASAQSLAVDMRRAVVLRRALEEWGVRCREHAWPGGPRRLRGDLRARRGGRRRADLPPAGPRPADARGIARLLMHDDRQFATWFDDRSRSALRATSPRWSAERRPWSTGSRARCSTDGWMPRHAICSPPQRPTRP